MPDTRRVTLDDFNDIPAPAYPEETELSPFHPAANGEQPFRLQPLTARQITALPDPPATDLLLGPYAVKGSRTIIVGDTGHGKTTFALQMIAAILNGTEMLHERGAAQGPALIVDLEQGMRSIKRSLHQAGLAHADDVLYITVPDGLALDSQPQHLAELERVIAESRPVVVTLDPYYKAHRGDVNEERAIIALMRALDGLRARHGFALILPAHPRKDIVGAKGARKLTLHDVSGSGAVVRGAEIVIGIERLNHGYARLRYLKDRDGDLPVGDAIPLIYSKEHGYRPDPKEEQTDQEIEQRIAASDEQWRTVKEWAAELGVRESKAKKILDLMVENGVLGYAVGPPGRSPKAHCYTTAPEAWAQSGAVTQSLLESTTAPTAPYYVGSMDGSSQTSAPETGSSDPTTAADDIPF